MLWYLLINTLMVYPIAELSRLIYVYYFTVDPNVKFIFEFVAMWAAYLIGMILMAGRLR